MTHGVKLGNIRQELSDGNRERIKKESEKESENEKESEKRE
jgi:hypothetical protein